MGVVPKRAAYEVPMMMEHVRVVESMVLDRAVLDADLSSRECDEQPVGDWTFDLLRSGKPRCRCRAVAQGVPVREKL